MKNLYIHDEFINEFHAQLPKHPTYEQAYEATEELCQQQNGSRRYANWDSFRQVLHRHLKNRMTKK